MDDAAWAREHAKAAVQDVSPDGLQERITSVLDTASMLPAVLTLACARATDPSVDADAVTQRAAGVQLIYDGLRVTRTLAHTEPWAGEEAEIAADLDVLVADVLVSRGFYLLARTEAAERAVETVRAFGRDQTARRHVDDPAEMDRNLERSVFDLAAAAGGTITGPASDTLCAQATALADDIDHEQLPAPARVLDEEFRADLADSTGTGGDSVSSAAGDTGES
jgi:predicted outer membrane protein